MPTRTKAKKAKKPARKAKPEMKQNNPMNNPGQSQPNWSQRPDWERNPQPVPPTPNLGNEPMEDEDNG
jgi:hypothetical protein